MFNRILPVSRAFVPVLSVFTALLVFTACTRQQEGGMVQASGAVTELRYGFTTEPVTLDPLNPSNTADGRSILFNVFEGLVKPDTGGRLQPCVAESWTIEQGGLVYNFKLRQDMRFHDGSILNVDDVKFTLDTAAAAGFEGFTGIEKVEVSGQDTVSVILKAPDPEFLPYITIGIVKADNPDREKNPIGTGPYYIENYTMQQSLVLRKFEDYWQRRPPESRDLPHLDKVAIVFLADSSALLLGLWGGSIDGASITGSLSRQLDARDFDIVPGYSASVHLLALNNAAPPLDDIRVRQALNYAIDIQGIIDAAFFGQGEPSGSPLIPGLTDYYEQALVNPYPLDLDRARSLLAEAGYSEDRRRLSLEITVPSNYTMHVDTAQVIAGQLAEAGIDTEIKLVDWASWLSDVYRNRDYQATIISLDANNVSPRGFLSRYRSDSGGNFINFKNGDFDRVYDAALHEIDDVKRAGLFKEAQRIISANAAGVYIQDIFYFKAFRRGTYDGVLNYPLYAIDFASIYGVTK
ncbi:MAG: ABC transporter substrate-binding protein [Treponema sp.]|jgi:peptide/nickel transport system substrate-binding protein|nr:ABC transporter substrate-binding protein [Treponema sp.]